MFKLFLLEKLDMQEFFEIQQGLGGSSGHFTWIIVKINKNGFIFNVRKIIFDVIHMKLIVLTLDKVIIFKGNSLSIQPGHVTHHLRFWWKFTTVQSS